MISAWRALLWSPSVRLVMAILAAFLPCSGVGGAQDPAPAPASPSIEDTEERVEDRDAIRGELRSFLEALRAGDAKALADHSTAEWEFVGVDAGPVRGRESLERTYAAMFEEVTKPEAEVTPVTLRFVVGDVSFEEGSVTDRREASGPPVSALSTALFVREGGRWRLARLDEEAVVWDDLRDLDWLVGEWRSSDEEGEEVQTTDAWDRNKVSLHVDFLFKKGNRVLNGTQILDIDPSTVELKLWTLEATGGVGEATWVSDGDRWVIDAVGSLADGSTLADTSILTRVDDDTFTWQSVGRTLDDVELADLLPTRVTRVALGPAPDASM